MPPDLWLCKCFSLVGATCGRPRASGERPYGGADLHLARARDRMKNVTQDSGPKFAPIYRIPSCGVGANSGKRKRLRRSEYTTHKQKRRTAQVPFCVFVMCVRFRCKTVCGQFRCTQILQRIDLFLGGDGSCT